MAIVGLGIDYNNICKDYNTVYLDRDNTDRATINCMNSVTTWLNEFLNDLLIEFDYTLFKLTTPANVKIDEVASRRFLFYSLEKEITPQSFVVAKEYTKYNNLTEWSKNATEGLAIKNDDEGEGFYLYMQEGSEVHKWILEKLKDFSLDEVPLD